MQPLLGNQPRLVAFTTPTPEGVEYVGRNHPLVEGLARYLFEEALENQHNPTAARCGFTVTDAGSRPTVVLLLRLRHLLNSPKHEHLLAEECLVRGFTGAPANPQWLTEDETRSLLHQVEPAGDLSLARKRLTIDRLLSRLEELEPHLEAIAKERSRILRDSHRRVRNLTQEGRVQVKPQLPMDILGIYIFQPQ